MKVLSTVEWLFIKARRKAQVTEPWGRLLRNVKTLNRGKWVYVNISKYERKDGLMASMGTERISQTCHGVAGVLVSRYK